MGVSEGDPTIPGKGAVKKVQAVIGGDTNAVETTFDLATLDAEGLARVEHRG